MQALVSLFETFSQKEPSFPFQKELREKIDFEKRSFVESSFEKALHWPTELHRSRDSQLGDIHALIDDSCKRSHLVFIDGVLQLGLSDISSLPKACVILPTSKALKIYGPILASRFKEESGEKSKDLLETVNNAFFEEGVVIFIPARLSLENPLQILLLSSEAPHVALPRIDIIMGKESSMDILISSEELSKEPLKEAHKVTIASLQASLDEGAKLSICDAVLPKESSVHFYDFQIRKDAKVSVWNANFSLAHALYTKANLDGEGAEFEIKGISTLQPYSQGVVKVLAEHSALRTKSHQHFKQILSAGSKSLFEGKIYVHKEALLTEAYQRSQALLLSDHAYAVSRPNLEIFADDVKASHGATVATLREEEAHYLRTRGLSSQDARNLLIEGFVNEIAEDIPYPNVREKLMSALQVLVSTLAEVAL